MSLGNRKIEGGHRSGHSNMAHWEYTGTIKEYTKKLRRQQDHIAELEDDYVFDYELDDSNDSNLDFSQQIM